MKSLEKNEPESFGHLIKSLREDATKWVEYFRLNSKNDLLEKDIDLLNECPLGPQMGLLEKLTLWMCARPDKVNLLKYKLHKFA
jgi:hypothetical protein